MTRNRYKSSGWYRFWRAGAPTELVVDGTGVTWWDGASVVETMTMAELASPPSVVEGLLWSQLSFPGPTGVRLFGGLSRTDSAQASDLASQFWRAHQALALAGPLSQRRDMLSEWEKAASCGRWMRSSWAGEWNRRAQLLPSVSTDQTVRDQLPALDRETLTEFDELVANLEERRTEANRRYEAQALSRNASFFDSVESQPLSPTQRLACVRDEDNNLVLAGAGSGKTSVIVARAAYLVDAGLAKPEEILVLAFNTDAAQEVRDRLTRQVENLAGLTVATFHAFGKAVATAGMPRQPSVSRLAQDDASLPEFVLARLASLAAEGGGLGDPDLRVFLERHLTPPDTESPDDLVAGFNGPTASGRTLLDSVRAASLRGDPMATADFRYRVRSNQEAQIANFLFLNQVEYLYEPDYESPTATFERRQYRPDFYLPQQKLYLEHFAVNHPSQTCPDFIPKDAYLEGVAWKRDLHRRHGTRMIETCSADANGPDGLIGALERALRQEGVELRPRPLAPLFADVDLRDRFDPRVVLVLLLTRFVTTAKVSLRSDAELQAAAREGGDRHIRFLSIAQRIRADYETELRGNAEIDFSDMLIDATQRIRSGAYRSQFRYILVDEFQDLSTARASLILALRDTVPGSSIFGVGDDWQSVYGFTGSDVSWTTAFADRFGACVITALDHTYRFDQTNADLARAFVTRNPAQSNKHVRALRPGSRESVSIVFAPRSTRRSGLEASIIKGLLHHDGEHAPRGTALILTRYRPTTDDLAALAALKREVPELALRLSTVHRAKGQQADFVFVMGLAGGLLGFPNAMEDDPVLHMVLPKPEPFAFAEERRLMYVAMTRARRKVWLVAPKDNPSGFLTELMEQPGGDVRTLVFTDGQLVEGAHVPHRCPACRTGVIIERSGSYGPFLGCSAFPICQATFKACPRCGSQPFLPDGQVFRCPDKDCGHSLPTCPDCARMIQPRWTGFLVPRDGRYGPFLGCHNWRPGDAGCSRTQRAA